MQSLPETLKDAKGRTLRLRTLGVLDQVRLLRAMGPAQATNEPYVNLVNAAAAIAEIDGAPQPLPANERQIDDMIARVADEGFAAIMSHCRAAVKALEDAAEAARLGAVDPSAEGAAPSPFSPAPG